MTAASPLWYIIDMVVCVLPAGEAGAAARDSEPAAAPPTAIARSALHFLSLPQLNTLAMRFPTEDDINTALGLKPRHRPPPGQERIPQMSAQLNTGVKRTIAKDAEIVERQMQCAICLEGRTDRLDSCSRNYLAAETRCTGVYVSVWTCLVSLLF